MTTTRPVGQLALVGSADAFALQGRKVDAPAVNLADAMAASLQSVTKLRGTVELVAAGSLPNDGKVIDDGRDHVNGTGSQYHNLAPIRSNRRHTMGV